MKRISCLLVTACLLAWPVRQAWAGDDAGARDLPSRIDTALDRAARFLISRQGQDGAWRSGVYGALKDGSSLTPQALVGLYEARGSDPALAHSLRRGRDYLSNLLRSQREGDGGKNYSIYSAAVACRLLNEHPLSDGETGQSFWLQSVRERQMVAELGWKESDPSFGGWGYSVGPPVKPGQGHEHNPFAFSNISATVYALDAMRSAKIPDENRAYSAALQFVKRCQNFSEDASGADPAFDDGGFFFTPEDAAWNKAGAAGTDRLGRTRFHSYGAATADGLRALRDAGLAVDHPRVVAARKWLESHFDAKVNPGTFQADRKVLQNATYFYYCASVAQAFSPLGGAFKSGAGEVQWAKELGAELLHQQQGDGSWKNPYTDAKEDDPLVSTPSAMIALRACRAALD